MSTSKAQGEVGMVGCRLTQGALAVVARERATATALSHDVSQQHMLEHSGLCHHVTVSRLHVVSHHGSVTVGTFERHVVTWGSVSVAPAANAVPDVPAAPADSPKSLDPAGSPSPAGGAS